MTLYIDNRTNSQIKEYLTFIETATAIYDKSSKHYYLKIGCGFDIETSVIEMGDFVTGYCYHWQLSLGDNVFMGRHLDSMYRLFSTLIEIIQGLPKSPRLLVLDANCGYEWQYCKKRWFYLSITEFFAKKERRPLKFLLGGCLEFREVLGLFGYSLEDIAKHYCTTQKLKGDLDYHKVRLSNTDMSSQEIQYCINDVVILSELGNYIFDHFFGHNPTLPLTKTAIIRNKIKRVLGKGLKAEKARVRANMPDSAEDYNLMRKYLFKGGWCGTNIIYMNEVLEDVVCADYTSDYPARMEHELYPDGKIIQCQTNEFLSENIPYVATIRFHNLRSRTSHSLLSVHKLLNSVELFSKDKNKKPKYDYNIDNGRIYSAEWAQFMVNDKELEGLRKAYTWEDAAILKCWKFERYTQMPMHIRKILREQYLVKQKLKEEGKTETLDYRNSKEQVNGIFGMLATAMYFEQWALDGTPNVNIIIDEEQSRTYEQALESLIFNPFLAFWVTTYARNYLIDVITKYPEQIIQYDTDSIYFLDDGSDELRKYLKAYNERIYKRNETIFNGDYHFVDLGAWEIEEPFKRFKGLGSKRYIYEKKNGDFKQVVAGCRKGSMSRQVEKFNAVRTENELEPWDEFDLFEDGMEIDKDCSNKLGTKYVDQQWEGYYTDSNGNTEYITCPSAAVLFPMPFSLGLQWEFEHLQKTIERDRNNEQK